MIYTSRAICSAIPPKLLQASIKRYIYIYYFFGKCMYHVRNYVTPWKVSRNILSVYSAKIGRTSRNIADVRNRVRKIEFDRGGRPGRTRNINVVYYRSLAQQWGIRLYWSCVSRALTVDSLLYGVAIAPELIAESAMPLTWINYRRVVALRNSPCTRRCILGRREIRRGVMMTVSRKQQWRQWCSGWRWDVITVCLNRSH